MEVSNETLVARARDGDQDAWDELVGRFMPVLMAVALRLGLSRADAADAVQMGWLVTTCRRESFTVLRLRNRCLPADLSDVDLQPVTEQPPVDPADAALARCEQGAVRDAVGRLPARHQAVLLALFTSPAADRGDYAMLAADLGIPIGSIGPTRSRALRRLSMDPALREAALN
jgi:DNA-directed RNA polymerase specialized sigma24 family protein